MLAENTQFCYFCVGWSGWYGLRAQVFTTQWCTDARAAHRLHTHQFVLSLVGKHRRPNLPLRSLCHWRSHEGLCWHQWLLAGAKAASFYKNGNWLLQAHEFCASRFMHGPCTVVLGLLEEQPPASILPSMWVSQSSQSFHDLEVCHHRQGRGHSRHYFSFAYRGVSPGAQMLSMPTAQR